MDDITSDAQRKRRLLIFGGVVLAAIVAVAIVIAVSSGGSDNKTSSSPVAGKSTGNSAASGLKSVAQVKSEFAGIPQNGNTLGKANAPATLMVFADLQCPFCAQFENQALPAIVARYVKSGKLKVVFQPIAIIGNDSVLGVRASAAAALQKKMFDFNALVYRNQGKENSGYMTEAYLKKIAAAAGLDATKLGNDLKNPQAEKIATAAQSLATTGHINSTPTVLVAKTGQPLQTINFTQFTPQAFYPAIDKAIG